MSSLRRLPWTTEGKESFVSAGQGIVNRLADAAEHHSLDVAEEAVPESLSLAEDTDASEEDLRTCLRALSFLARDLAAVAHLRGDRLGINRSAAPTEAESLSSHWTDVTERVALSVAGGLMQQGRRASLDRETAPGEMRRLLRLVTAATQDALDIARIRGERLEAMKPAEHPTGEDARPDEPVVRRPVPRQPEESPEG